MSSKRLLLNAQFSLLPCRLALEMQQAPQMTFIVEGQVLSWNEKGPLQSDDYFLSVRILLHSWAPFYVCFAHRTCMQSHYINTGSCPLHTHRHTHRVYMHRAVCRTSAVCSMIWWKTWADRSRTDQWINLGPCDIYGCLCMCRGERGAADWNGSNDWMRGRKGTGWRGCEGREGELCDVDEVVWKERRRSGGFRALARALQNCVHWVWSKYNTWIRGGNFISSVKNQTILIFILGSVGVLKLLESSACGEWDAGDRAGPASQERMLVTGGRRQTDMGCGALCPPGRTSACNLSPICSTGQEACSYLLCYPYLTKRMDTHPHFMTVDWGGGGVEWCVVRRLGMPFNPFQCARNVTKWNLLCKKGWAKSCSMQNPSRGVN